MTKNMKHISTRCLFAVLAMLIVSQTSVAKQRVIVTVKP